MPRGKPKQVHLPVDELRSLYVDRLMSSYDIAEHFGCSPPVVLSRLKDAGIPVRKVGNSVRGKPRRHHLSKTELERLYTVEQWSSDRIAERYGCSTPVVLQRLREAGIAVRHHNDTKRGKPSPNRLKLDESAVVAAYTDRPTTAMAEIAKDVGCSVSVIARVLDEHQVPRKSSAEIYEGKRNGPANPNWRDDLTTAERLSRRDMAKQAKWRVKVYERDGFTCTVCKDATGGNLNAHHIESHDARPDIRWDVENGVTLCDGCHRTFHKRFGYGGNTVAQFTEFAACP